MPVIGRQGEKERRTLLRLTFGPDPAAVAFNDPFDRCQSDTRARKFIRMMKTLKGVEHLGGIFHIEARAIVTNVENRMIIQIG